MIDNVATVLAWERGRSKQDEWATIIVRATAHVCAELNVKLFVEWQRRCSSRETIAADSLSHDRTDSLLLEETDSYLTETMNGFPEPRWKWMEDPKGNIDLGPKLVMWLRNRYVLNGYD